MLLDLAVKAWKRLLTLRLVAWSPPLVAAVVTWWILKFWRDRRRKASEASAKASTPAVDSTKFTERGAEAERSAFLTGDGVYSHGEFAGGR
jgi:hypothetical protein